MEGNGSKSHPYLYLKPAFTIYYGNNKIYKGKNYKDWRKAPKENVQVITLDCPRPDRPPKDKAKTGFVFTARKDKVFFTGIDKYDPLNYKVYKLGKLISDKEYNRIWDLAYGSN